MKPDISIVMSIYNESKFEIELAINSILSQSFSNYEFIIVNDNCRRSLNKEILDSYASLDSRIEVIHNIHNAGLAESLNTAIRRSKGKYIARMDADDISMPERLQKQYDVICQKQYDVVCTRFSRIGEDDREKTSESKDSSFFSSYQLEHDLPITSHIHHPTVMMTREIVERVGLYRGFRRSQDFDLWLRILYAKGKFYMIDEVLLLYRIRSSSISSVQKVKQKYTLEYIRKLYIERLLNGTDSFSNERYNNFLLSMIYDESKMDILIRKGDAILDSANEYIQKKKLKGYFKKIYVFISNPVYRHIYFSLIVDSFKIWILNKIK